MATNIKEMHEHIIKCYPQEAVGVIIDDIFYPLDNIADDPINNFRISKEDTEQLLDKDFSIIHSHTMTQWAIGYDPRTPSHNDLITVESYDVPFGIVHCDGESVTDILWINRDIPELLGRHYVSGLTDCFTLARDYYINNYNINFGIHPRPANWEEWNPHYIEQHYHDLGFSEIDGSELQEGDIILFSIGSRHINHIGVYIGDNRFIHHLYNRLSSSDTLSKWHRQIVKYLRIK
jgi:proteasome lid subunit RPN8/RPN11